MGKRFTLGSPTGKVGVAYTIRDNETNREMLSQNEFLNKLNELSERQRIANITNQALIRFIKSKGYNVEEVLEFVNEL